MVVDFGEVEKSRSFPFLFVALRVRGRMTA
jgi:hypothetical protein